MTRVSEFAWWVATCWRPPTVGAAALSQPEVARDFMRCTTCGRVFMHYWACKPAGEPGRIGCPCGSREARTCLIPEWQAAYYVLSRYVVRKLVLRRQYWDPRLPCRKAPLDV